MHTAINRDDFFSWYKRFSYCMDDLNTPWVLLWRPYWNSKFVINGGPNGWRSVMQGFKDLTKIYCSYTLIWRLWRQVKTLRYLLGCLLVNACFLLHARTHVKTQHGCGRLTGLNNVELASMNKVIELAWTCNGYQQCCSAMMTEQCCYNIIQSSLYNNLLTSWNMYVNT